MRSDPPTRFHSTALTSAGCGPTGFARTECIFGSTGSTLRLMNYGSFRTILTDVAADMLNFRETRIAREMPVLREVPVARKTTVKRKARNRQKTPIA